MRTSAVLCSILSLVAVSSPVAAFPDDPRIDATTGRDLANYPPPRHFDHIHMKLAIDIPDMAKAFFNGIETLTVTPIGQARPSLILNCKGPKVESVSLAGKGAAGSQPLTFVQDDNYLTITFKQPVKLGETIDLIIRYTVDSPKPDGTGLTWTKGRPDATNETNKFAQIHSQGEPEHNRQWYPCHDFPNERLTTEMFVTVEDPYVVASNGRLIDNVLGSPSANGKPRLTWHWLQDKPHSNYLVSLVVGRFSIVGLTASSPEEARIPCWLYAPVGQEKQAAAAYARTPAMVAHFSDIFGQPYAWDKYAQSLVRNFAMGGMENTSVTTMQSSSATAPPGSQDDIISHELAHQWFGDLMTCKSWEHAWLNEGWASFAEAIWKEKAAKPGDERREYQKMIAGFVRQQRGMNRTSAPNSPPLESNRYNDPMANFMKANDIYSKGACVLHMLRVRLGDDAFWKGVHLYIERNKLRCVETDDFRYCLEEVSGQSLERFFTQWCLRPGLPRLDVEIEWTPEDSAKPDGAGEVRVSMKQSQKIDRDNPAYAMSLPVYIKSSEDKGEYRYVDMDTKEAEFTAKLAAKPADVVVDPGLTIVVSTSVKKPLAMWLKQLRARDSYFAQIQAIDELGLIDDPVARQALAELAADPGQDDQLRVAARESLERTVAPIAARSLQLIGGGN